MAEIVITGVGKPEGKISLLYDIVLDDGSVLTNERADFDTETPKDQIKTQLILRAQKAIQREGARVPFEVGEKIPVS